MIKTIIQGFLIGCAKIIPGFSGSLLAITFGVYKKTLTILSNIKKITLKNIIYVFFLGIGIIIGIILFSYIIKHLLKTSYFLIMLLFIGLIIGSIKDLICKVQSYNKIKGTIYFILSFLLVIIFSFNHGNTINSISTIVYLPLGFLEAFTTLIPGISGTVIYMILGVYDLILNLYIEFNILNLILFGLGFIIGVLILSKILTLILKKYSIQLFIVILGFMCASIISLIKDVLSIDVYFPDILFGILFLIIGYFISNKLNHLF